MGYYKTIGKSKSRILNNSKTMPSVKSIGDVKGYNYSQKTPNYTWNTSFEKDKNQNSQEKSTIPFKPESIPSPAYEAKVKQSEPLDQYGNTGVRAAMVNMGLDNSKIGWEDGYVTYGGMRFKPANVQDGTSYAKRGEIQNFVNELYKAQGKTPVKVTDYAAEAGLGSVSYSPERGVMVDGKSLPMLYMDGDRAVVSEEDLQNAYKEMRERLGISTASELYNSWEKKYKKRMDKAYNDVAIFKPWEYNPETDSEYKAYKEESLREGERAYRDAAARMAAKNNGNMTSAAHTVANQQLAEYVKSIGDKIPELSQNSYERYKAEFDKKLQNYNALAAEAQKSWQQLVEMNDIAKQDYYKQREGERQRNQDAKQDITNEYKNQQLVAELAQSEIDNAFANADARGYFTEQEAILLQIPKNSEGNYLTPNEIKIQNEIQYFNEVLAPQLDYESLLELNNALAELAEKRKTSLALASVNHANDMSLAKLKSGLSLSSGKDLAAFKSELDLENKKEMAEFNQEVKKKYKDED